MENLVDDDLEKSSSDEMSLIVNLMMKQNLIIKKIMMNLPNDV